ncbi:MAG TPA: hypothetical protein VK705_10115 [Ferruginibacter sp.]|jgi:hypothetical protein|nr:hypothetical protein [Ferruginibacter sp.]
MSQITSSDKRYLLAIVEAGKLDNQDFNCLESESGKELLTNYYRNIENLKKHFKEIVEKQEIIK